MIGLAVWLGVTAKKVTPTVTSGEVSAQVSRRLAGVPYALGGVSTGGSDPTMVDSRSCERRTARSGTRGLDHRSDVAYDATSGRAQSWRLASEGTAATAADASEDVGLAPGPPDPDGATRYLRDDELGAIVAALNTSPATLARSGRQHGRNVWIIDLRLRTSPDVPVDAMHVVIDQRSKLPVELTRSVKGVVIDRKQFSALRLVSNVRPDTFGLSFPAGTGPARSDGGFQRVPLPGVPALVGYAPMTPEWLPAGYELSAVAVLRGSPPGLAGTAGGDNPPNRDVTSLTYRRGVEQLTVTLRRVGGPGEQWKDPFRSGGGPAGRVQRQRLDGGHFVGTPVEQVTVAAA